MRAKTAVTSAFQGFFVDMVDVYVAIIALTPALRYFLPGNLSPRTATVLTSLLLVATLLGRPLGSAIFGTLADLRGRRAVTLVSVAGFGVLTLAIALLPGYATWGVWAPATLIVLRFVSGIFLGGEYSASFPLALEYTAPARRGFVGALVTSAYPLAYVFVSLVVLITLQFAPASGDAAPYTQWGWRIAFVVGALLAFAFLTYRWRSLPESDAWLAAARTEGNRPAFRDFLQRGVLVGFARMTLLMTGVWMGSLTAIGILPAQLIGTFHIPATTVTTAQLLTFAIIFVLYIAGGVLAERIGRRRYLIVAGVVIGLVAGALYGVFQGASGMSDTARLTLAGLIMLLTLLPFSVVTTYINEQFDTTVRSRGFGISYGFALIFGSLYSFYMLGLGQIMPYQQTGTVLIVVSGVLIVVGAALTRRGSATSTEQAPLEQGVHS
ncbi:MAG TPA: MFS transporter [Pseudonocardia sp.]